MIRSLAGLSAEEWESICDGCGRCCMVKLQDDDSGEIAYTNVSCKFLDHATCRCTDYENRSTVNPRCMVLAPDRMDVLEQMPFTCAYRLVHEQRELPPDYGDLGVSGKVVSEEYIHEDQLPEHIIQWISVESLEG